MTYRLINEKYGNEPAEVTMDELTALLREVFDDHETGLVERVGGIYEIGGDQVAEPVNAQASSPRAGRTSRPMLSRPYGRTNMVATKYARGKEP